MASAHCEKELATLYELPHEDGVQVDDSRQPVHCLAELVADSAAL
jgi:hypothetical protein